MRASRFMRGDNTRYGKRHKPGEMNKTEQAYADLLEARRLSGEVINWKFEAMTFKLADSCRLTPDFAVWLSDGTMEFVDAKGGGPVADDALVKLKCVAEQFPQFTFVMEKARAKRDGGGWERRVF